MISGWAVAATVIALAWVGSRPGRRLVTGFVIGTVTGLLWPVVLWVGAGVLVAQHRRRTRPIGHTFRAVTVLGCALASIATFGVLAATAPPPVAVAAAAAAPAPAVDRAAVTAVVDGDTLDVDLEGRPVRVRMLNVDAPELSGDEDARCLGPEAAAHLTALLPAGTDVVLEYDVERTDAQGRTMAAVLTGDGVLVNAEMARAGLAAGVVGEGGIRFLPAVEAAQREAAEQGRGLHGAGSACTLPGRLQAVDAAVVAIPAAASLPAGTSAEELERMAGDAAGVVTLAASYRDGFAVARHGVLWAVHTAQEHERFAAEVTRGWESAARAEEALRGAAATARATETEAARAAEQQAAQQQAAQQRAAQEQAAQQRAAETRAADRRAAAAAPERPAPADEPAPSSGSGGGPVVHPGSFCDDAGAMGVTKKGTAMRCQLDSKGERLRWSGA